MNGKGPCCKGTNMFIPGFLSIIIASRGRIGSVCFLEGGGGGQKPPSPPQINIASYCPHTSEYITEITRLYPPPPTASI